MVYYFKSNLVDPPAFIYVGKDKIENEELIKFGWEEDVWFHVDKLSSAHVYLRLPDGETWDDIPADLLKDCAQLTKANSIEGNKKDNITIIYTPWSNLRKDGSMAAGQVSFKDPRRVKRIMVETRENPIINRLNKTKVEKFPDLMAEKEERLKVLRVKQRKEAMARMKEEERIAKERKEMAYKRDHAYDDMFDEEALEQSSNQERGAEYWDDFM
ncbi:hypothetical protein FPQ18DRAFT_350995 [Pyronema domesticum]|nr:hypothetical protein FPQ18DRAFT_350995 [Pyronema domesticum]